MKICLISAPTVSEFDVRLAESRAVRRVSEQPPLGILALAAILEQSGIASEIVDLNKIYYRYLRAKCRADFCAYVAREFEFRSFDLFGFSTICSTYPLTIRIARELKKSHPRACILMGGPHASVVDIPTLSAFPFVDFIVRGEADETLPALIKAVEDTRRFAGIPGITFRRGDRIIRNPDAPVVSDLDKLPMPAFHFYPGLERCPIVPLEIGRGCPFGCRFCSTTNFFGRQFRLKSPRRVIEQMCFVRQTYGIDHFDLIHDMFTIDRKRVLEFCQAMLTCGHRFQWACSARTDCLDDELIDSMRRAGCTNIFLGIETGSVRLQKEISKNLNLSEAAACIRNVTRGGIRTTVSLITGFPTETKKDLQRTISFLMDAARSDYAKPQLHILAPLAGTPIYEQYRDTLTLDDILSDVSCHGWRQHPADKELVRSYPYIFPNFYALPTALGRQYIKELRDFIQNGLLRCRWLLVGLHQDSGNLLPVFDAWRKWLGAKRRMDVGMDSEIDSAPYYSRIEFTKNLLDFIGNCYLPQANNPVALGALLDFELALHQTPRAHIPAKVPGAPRVARGIRILQIRADYLKVLDCLRDHKPLNNVRNRRVLVATCDSRDEMLKVIRLGALPAQLLTLCNGTRSIAEIAGRLRPGKSLAGIPREKVCLFGLASLREQGLIQYGSS
jgi:radical SAM superfamily enzyme YgiQ (UPF0313 family)